MSPTDYMRFITELQASSGLREEVAPLSTALALMSWAGARGYELSVEEAERLLESLEELSDDELDKVAGGEDAWGGGTGGTPPPTGP